MPLKLNLQKEPYWIDLPFDVRVKVNPCTTASYFSARSESFNKWGKILDEPGKETNEHEKAGLFEEIFIKALARNAIIEWEGVLNNDNDKKAPINDQTVSDLMEFWDIAQSFGKQYTENTESIKLEGNALGLCANGILPKAEGPNTVTDVKEKNSPVHKDKNQEIRNVAHT